MEGRLLYHLSVLIGAISPRFGSLGSARSIATITKRYNPNTKIQFYVNGFYSPDRDAFFQKGVLNTSATVYRNSRTDTPAVIIPKTGTVQISGNLEIRIQTPAAGWWFSESIPLSLRDNW